MLMRLNCSCPWLFGAGLCVSLGLGCGSGSDSVTPKQPQAKAAKAPAADEPADPEGPALVVGSTKSGKILPTAAIGTSKNGGVEAIEDRDDPKDEAELNAALNGPPREGTAEWYVYETSRLRVQHGANGADADEAATEKLKAARKERNEKIIAHAQKAIALAHDQPEKAPLFQTAVRHLLDARMQLAMASEKEHIEALFEDAAALAQRDPHSQPAAEAAHKLVELAYFHARNSQKEDTRWLQEFAFQAAHFATQFPKEEPRSVPLLFTAARSCELFGLNKEAMNGYAVILEKFPNNAYAPRTAGILRRMRLSGQSVDLSGTLLNGKPFNITSLRGKPVLVVFWSTDAQPCIEQMPVVIAAAKKFTPDRLSVVGVNLDTSTAPVKQFLLTNKIGWPQIFPAEEDKRGWNHPIVNKYSVLEIPSLWLVDATGKVVTTSVTSDDLESELEKLIAGPTTKDAEVREVKAEVEAPKLETDKSDATDDFESVEKPAKRSAKKSRTTSDD